MDIIFEDSSILALNKPAGISVQPDYSGQKSLLDISAKYLNCSIEEVHIINRLDKPVGGITLIAKNKHSAANLAEQIKTNTIKKHYYAVVIGKTPDYGICENYMIKIGRLNISKIVDKNYKGAKFARLCFENRGLSLESEILSLLYVGLETGRHHQIRLQLSNASFPIWGDRKYNNSKKYRYGENIALYSHKIVLSHPKDGKVLTLEAPLPTSSPFNRF